MAPDCEQMFWRRSGHESLADLAHGARSLAAIYGELTETAICAMMYFFLIKGTCKIYGCRSVAVRLGVELEQNELLRIRNRMQCLQTICSHGDTCCSTR